MKIPQRHRKLHFENLERRIVLSFIFSLGDDIDEQAVDVGDLRSSDHHNPGHGGGPGGGGGGGGKPKGPAIDLPTVAAHELGHSLGLGHSGNDDCGSAGQPLMCPFYIGESFSLHAEDIDLIQALYPASGPNVSGAWNSANITYSFTPDRARMESGGRNALFKTMDGAFDTTDQWQQIFVDALDLWADNSQDTLVFTEVGDDGSASNVSGASQGDSRFGDIRFAAHGFDGASGILAHAYFPPPNGATIAGDAHFDKAENWQDLRGAASAAFTGGGSGSSGAGNMTLRVETSPDALLTAALVDVHLTPLRSTILQPDAVSQATSQTIAAHDGSPLSPSEIDRLELRASSDIDRGLSISSLDEESDEDVLEKIDDAFQDWSTNDLADPFIVDIAVGQPRKRD